MESGEGFHGYSKPAAQIESSTGKEKPEILGDDKECLVREQDRFMPIANVIRLMRKIIPSHAKISDDAKETIQDCVSEFISFVTGEANARCQQEQRKTITAEDVLWAMSTLGFDEYIEPLTIYLNRFRDIDGGGSIKGEQVLKMSNVVESGALGFAAFAPAFHNGFFGSTTAAMGGFMMNDGHNAGPSAGAAVARVETCAKYKE